VWALYGRESLDPKGTAVQVTNQLADLRPFALGIGGRIGREYPENNVSAFKRVKVLLPDGTFGYRVVRPDWDAMMTALRRGSSPRWRYQTSTAACAIPGIWKI
jgi:hypothetical protein